MSTATRIEHDSPTWDCLSGCLCVGCIALNDSAFEPADFIEEGFSVVIARSRRIAVGSGYDVSFCLVGANIIDRHKVLICRGAAVCATATSLAAPAIA